MSKKRRRSAGSGSVFPWKKRNPETGVLEQVGWCGTVDLGVVERRSRKTGRVELKRGRQTLYAPMNQKKQLEARVTATQHAKNSGTAPTAGRLMVSEWLATWLLAKEMGSKKIRPRTIEHYRLVVDKHIVPAIGQKQLAKLTPSDVERMLGAQLRAGRSARSVSHVRAVLRNALARAERDGKVNRNVARLAEAPSVPEPDRASVEAFSEMVPTFLRALDDNRLGAMYAATLGLGLRLGEVTGLRWSDIDLDAGVLHVTKSLQWIRPAGEKAAVPQLLEPKTEKSRRELQLSDPMVKTLRQHRARWRDEKLALGPRSLNEFDLVFTGPAGEPLNPRVISEQFRAILRKADLPRIRFHDLRHANASLLLTAHVPMEMLSKLLGHSNPTTTRNIYVHVLKPLQEEAKRAQARLLTSGG